MANGQIDPDARFKRLREQAKQETTAGTQARKEALQRRFAQAGLLGSGAAIKQEQIAEKEGQSALARRLGQIESAQESEALRRQEIEAGRKFQAGEAEKQRGFAAEQAGLGREFAKGERLAGQEFAAGQAGIGREFAAEQQRLGREFQTGEREAGQAFAAEQALLGREQQEALLGKQQDFAAAQAQLARDVQAGQFTEQMDFAREQFDFDKKITEFNQALAENEQNKKDMFAKIGDLGTDAWSGVTGGGSSIAGDIFGGLATGGMSTPITLGQKALGGLF